MNSTLWEWESVRPLVLLRLLHRLRQSRGVRPTEAVSPWCRYSGVRTLLVHMLRDAAVQRVHNRCGGCRSALLLLADNRETLRDAAMTSRSASAHHCGGVYVPNDKPGEAP